MAAGDGAAPACAGAGGAGDCDGVTVCAERGAAARTAAAAIAMIFLVPSRLLRHAPRFKAAHPQRTRDRRARLHTLRKVYRPTGDGEPFPRSPQRSRPMA
jgi:hypothetical protein